MQRAVRHGSNPDDSSGVFGRIDDLENLDLAPGKAIIQRFTGIEGRLGTSQDGTGVFGQLNAIENLTLSPTSALAGRFHDIDVAIGADDEPGSLRARIKGAETASVDSVTGKSAVTIAQEASATAAGVTANGRRSNAVVADGSGGTNVVIADVVSRQSGGVKTGGGEYLVLSPDGSVYKVIDVDHFYVGRYAGDGSFTNLRKLLEIDAGTGRVIVNDLLVIRSLIAPGTLFRDARKQLGSNVTLASNSSGQNTTPVPDSAGFFYTFTTDGPGSLVFISRLLCSVDGSGTVQLYAGLDGAYEEIGEPIIVGGGGNLTKTATSLFRFTAAGTHTLRLAFSLAPSGVGAQVSFYFLAGARFDVEVFLQGTAS